MSNTTRQCAYLRCGTPFEPRVHNGAYCSKSCANRANKAKRSKPCTVTGCVRVRSTALHCSMHDMRLRKTGTTGDPAPKIKEPRSRLESGVCARDECANPLPAGRKSNKRYCSQRCAARQNYIENKSRYNGQSSAWYAQNQESAKSAQLAWYRKNADAAKARARIWAGANRARRAQSDALRGASIRASRCAPITASALTARMAYFGFVCWMCGGPFEHVDHVKPVSRGGPHILSNLRPSCAPCNSKKRDKWFGPKTLSVFIRQ